MAPTLEGDEELHSQILAYVCEPKACLSCHNWKSSLYDSLQLEHRIRFKKRLAASDNLTFSYTALRPFGDDFQENVAYHFDFAADGTYKMQWTRTFDAYSSQCEQQVGLWQIDKNQLECMTKLPAHEPTEREVRYAPAGWKFNLMIDSILEADSKGGHFQAPEGAPAEAWELPARTGACVNAKADDGWNIGSSTSTLSTDAPSNVSSPSTVQSLRPDARYVEIDGQMHEVSGDIVANHPEHMWQRLMQCRLRFGINGSVG